VQRLALALMLAFFPTFACSAEIQFDAAKLALNKTETYFVFKVAGTKAILPATEKWLIALSVAGEKINVDKCTPNSDGQIGRITAPLKPSVGKLKVYLKVKLSDGTFVETTADVNFENRLECGICPPPPECPPAPGCE
jgi:hypothetical protein